MLFVLMQFLVFQDRWQISDTQIYHRLNMGSVVFVGDLDIFLLDRAERRILHFDKDGQKLAGFGKRGQGPGELQYPLSMLYKEGSIYVRDWRCYQVYSTEGHFIRKVNIPPQVGHLKSVFNGWVGLSAMDIRQPHEPRLLYWFSSDLSSEEILGSWPGDLSKKKISFSQNYCNPAEDYTLLTVDYKGHYVALKPFNTAQIHFFDMVHKKQVGGFKVDGPPIPFNKEWGWRQLEISNSKNAKCVPDFPAYFPIIQSLAWTRRGTLIVRKWLPDLNATESDSVKHRAMQAYTKNGEEREVSFIDREGGRILHEAERWYYVAVVLPDDEQGIIRIEKSDIVNFIKKNPYEVDGFFEIPSFIK